MYLRIDFLLGLAFVGLALPDMELPVSAAKNSFKASDTIFSPSFALAERKTV